MRQEGECLVLVGVRSPFAIVTRPGATGCDVVGVCPMVEGWFAGAKGIWDNYETCHLALQTFSQSD